MITFLSGKIFIHNSQLFFHIQEFKEKIFFSRKNISFRKITYLLKGTKSKTDLFIILSENIFLCKKYYLMIIQIVNKETNILSINSKRVGMTKKYNKAKPWTVFLISLVKISEKLISISNNYLFNFFFRRSSLFIFECRRSLVTFRIRK